MFECVMMGLRLRRGIDLEAFHQKYHVLLQEQFASALKKHLNKDLLIEDEEKAKERARLKELAQAKTKGKKKK